MLALADSVEEVLLRLAPLAMVPPPTQAVPQLPVVLSLLELVHYSRPLDARLLLLLVSEVGVAPGKEEPLFELELNLRVDQVVASVGLVDDGESFPVPHAQILASLVLLEGASFSNELGEHAFDVADLLRVVCNHQEGVLPFAGHVLGEHLAEKLTHELLHLVFVLATKVRALTMHRVHVHVIALVQLVHFRDEVVPIVRELVQLPVKHGLLLVRLAFLRSQRLQLIGEGGEAAARVFVLHFHSLQVVGALLETSVDCVGLASDLLGEVLFLVKTRDEGFLFALKSV